MRTDQLAHPAPKPGDEIPADIQTRMAHIDALDPFIHQPTRLLLLAYLAKQHEAVSFQTLLERLQMRRSNLSIQLKLLEQKGLLDVTKRREGRYRKTMVALTPAGREAITQHMTHVLAALGERETEEA